MAGDRKASRAVRPRASSRSESASAERRAADEFRSCSEPSTPPLLMGGAMRVCIVGASGKLGQYMTQHCLDRGYDVVGVCRAESVPKLDRFKGRITVVPGMTDDRDVIERAVAGCDGVLVVLAPRGMNHYSSRTAQAVLDYAEPGARLVFSCGWHITRDGQDHYSWRFRARVWVLGAAFRLSRMGTLADQVEATRRIFASDTRWTVVRGSDLEEGDSQ